MVDYCKMLDWLSYRGCYLYADMQISSGYKHANLQDSNTVMPIFQFYIGLKAFAWWKHDNLHKEKGLKK